MFVSVNCDTSSLGLVFIKNAYTSAAYVCAPRLFQNRARSLQAREIGFPSMFGVVSNKNESPMQMAYALLKPKALRLINGKAIHLKARCSVYEK